MTKQEFLKFKNINLEIRHKISEILPYLTEKDLKKYRQFFRYSERMEKTYSYFV